jgi:hypothetical protein
MGGPGYLTLSVLLVVLMPAMVMSLEGRKIAPAVYASTAVLGLGSSALRGGWPAVGSALAAAILVIVLLGGGTTILRASMRLRVLTGAQIKLMAAGATWLGLLGAGLMMVVVMIALFVSAAWRSSGERGRPDSVSIVVAAIFVVALQQNLGAFL